jgi:hypothetical protein
MITNTKKVNAIILRLACLQAGILHNANCYDDDKGDTWQAVKEDYENLKVILDKYFADKEKEIV